MRFVLLASLFALNLSCAAATAASPAHGRVQLDALLNQWEHLPPGSARDALSEQIDHLAAQRYAAWSQLAWHTDLEEAKAEARASGKPILSLRMLGRLDQELSCANSRFFRVALYANQEVSAYLRAHFVLHWSSERPVPVARIEFADGRVLERTVAGNSIHYVLDAQGRPIDALPGLYTPGLFLDILKQIEPVARQSGQLESARSLELVKQFHAAAVVRAVAQSSALGGIDVPRDDSLMSAERATMTKSVVERPPVEGMNLGRPVNRRYIERWIQRDARWAVLGEALAKRTGGGGLDGRSRHLVAAMAPTDWAHPGAKLSANGQERLIAAFETSMRADAAYNEWVLHPQLHQWLADAKHPLSFDALNARVYTELFHTPAEDVWLGMATPDVFTGLARDGVRAR